MKQRFCDYIKKAKIGDMFFYLETSDRFILIKIGKKSSDAIEICGGDYSKREIIEWNNEDKDKIIPIKF